MCLNLAVRNAEIMGILKKHVASQKSQNTSTPTPSSQSVSQKKVKKPKEKSGLRNNRRMRSNVGKRMSLLEGEN